MNARRALPGLVLVSIVLVLALSAGGSAQTAGSPGSTTDTTAIIYLSGDDPSQIGRIVAEGEALTVGEGAMLRLPDGSDVELDQRTTVEVRTLARPGGAPVTHLHLRRGAVRVAVPPRPTRGAVIFRVTSPVSTAGVRGTDFSVAYEPPLGNAIASEQADVDVFEGTVEVDNGGEPELVQAGDGASVSRRQVRRRAVARAIQERWETRRERIIERVRSKLRMGTDEDVAERIRERLRNLPPEKRELIQQRIRTFVNAQRERARARIEAIQRERQRQQERPPGRPLAPAPRPRR